MQKAVATHLPPEDMVSTLFIFSDMEFDQAAPGSYDETYVDPIYSDPICSDPALQARLNSYYTQYPRSHRERTNYQSVKVCASRCVGV